MKKILATLLATFALTSTATETITLVYSWTASDVAANYYRALVEVANSQQKKYNFVIDYKPGAGGTVAANHILNNKNAVQITSSAFFIRPNLYPDQSYDLDRFQSVMTLCLAPFSISSARYKSWEEVPTDKPLTIGISGLGTTTHLTAIQLAKKYPNMEIIPFKSTSEAVQATLGGQTDFAVGFVGDSIQYHSDNPTRRTSNILGISGSHSIEGRPLLINQGFPKILGKFGSPSQIIAPASMPEQQYREVGQILVEAIKSKKVVEVTENDYCFYNAEMSEMPRKKFYEWSRAMWRELTTGIKVN
jgi:tripartite-type tricarboxylate transporter receptor subunit TctC